MAYARSETQTERSEHQDPAVRRRGDNDGSVRLASTLFVPG
jgi:hypothetical protein